MTSFIPYTVLIAIFLSNINRKWPIFNVFTGLFLAYFHNFHTTQVKYQLTKS